MTAKPGVRVRGTCKAGHITETTADKGRVTWQGECSTEGCAEQVHAKRIPRDRVPAAPPPSETADGTTRVVRIADYDATSSGARDDTGGLVVAELPEPEPEPERRGRASAESGIPADPITEPEDRSAAGWFRRRRRAGAVRSARREYRHPLGI